MEKNSSAEKEFSIWLRRPEKTFRENLQFALNAWKSVDLTISNKYEIVLEWLADILKTITDTTDLPITELRTLLEQRALPGLVAPGVKQNFIESVLECTKNVNNKTREFSELLLALGNFETIQDILRSKSELQARVQCGILRQYELYLNQFSWKDAMEDNRNINCEYESKFFAVVMKTLIETAKRASDQTQYIAAYNEYVVQSLTEVILRLRAHKLCFFNDFLALEHVIEEDYQDQELIERIMKLPLHSRLLVLECAIANRRGVNPFIKVVLKRVFQNEHQPSLRLTIATYTLEMLRKYDINLAFSINESTTAIQFIGTCIYGWVKEYKSSNLSEVLMLLCATLRLNPLILEQHVFHITTWLIVAEKNDDSEQHIFEEYLMLLVDMFRRLSQVEKFVGNLLKSLNQWLSSYKLSVPNKHNSGKRKNRDDQTCSPKKRKLQSKSGALDTNNFVAANEDVNLQILFCDFYKMSTENRLNSESLQYENFPELRTHWPSGTVGVAFSRLVSGLMSKPSLVIWKTLLYGLKEVLDQLPNDSALNNNQLFQLDLYTALLTEYFVGCKLTEQYNIYNKQIDEQRKLTATILGQFGRYLLACEYHKRIVRGFLECSYSVGCFELILGYYRPDADSTPEDSCTSPNLIQSYLTKKEWTLMQQRVLNFGKVQCKFLFNRLQMQNVEASVLFEKTTDPNTVSIPTISLQKSTLTVLNEPKQLNMLMQSYNGEWVESHLRTDEKRNVCKMLLSNTISNELLNKFSEDSSALEYLVLSVYDQLQSDFAETSKHSLLANCQFNISTLYDCQNKKVFKQNIQTLMTSIKASAEGHCPSQVPVQAAKEALEHLEHLPISYLQRQTKCLVFAIHLALFCDLKATNETELATDAFNILADMLYFGPKVPILKYLNCDALRKLFPVHEYLEMYETLFVAIKNEEKGAEEFLMDLQNIIQESQKQSKLSSDERQLMLMAIESLASMNGPAAKRMRKHLIGLLGTYAVYIQSHFQQTKGEQPKKDKKFVCKTISGFAAYANVALTQTPTAAECKFVVDEEFRRLFKMYIGYSLDYRDVHGVRLMQVALNHRNQLNFAQNEIEFVLSAYWEQLNEDIKQHSQLLHTHKTAETVIKLIVAFKTNEDFLIMLKNIENMLTDKDFVRVTQLLNLIAKCSFSTLKSAIFNEQCKRILHNIHMQLAKNESQQFTNMEQVLGVLGCQLSIVENKMLTVSFDTLDGILSFLIGINIKRFVVNEYNISSFVSLYEAMIELCTALIKHRHILIVDRTAQFMYIFKDLIRSIIWYKCDRENDAALASTELDKLGELAIKLETLMHLIVNHRVSFKRIIPFILTFVISLMVAEKRTTTLYPNIKKHIESICYDLIGLCDNRVGGFILRCSNEASRQLYESLVKNHKKYHKFKGKV